MTRLKICYRNINLEEFIYPKFYQIWSDKTNSLRKSEGMHGVVVTFLASLELAKDGHVELIQNKTEEIFLKSLTGVTN